MFESFDDYDLDENLLRHVATVERSPCTHTIRGTAMFTYTWFISIYFYGTCREIYHTRI